MGKIFDQMELRKSYDFQSFMHAAVLNIAEEILHESESVEHHAARAAMASKIINTEEPVVREFVRIITYRAVMDDTIRNSVVKNGRVILETANEEVLLQGIRDVWNDVTMAAWPTILEDVSGGLV